ncbi:MAG: hypothetical protein PHX02_07650 [Oscillospiraceae bacterium]|jgi:hypothetical protein|uniref:Uncharacterized protein n=4 Tax=Clostridia TaxID=186801 RepID=A0A140L454_9FIRM|nr:MULTISPECIES: hypothetical protein [Clostridia]KXG75329.1 hypothetical protein AN619_17620 [Thermotalea metallivorans]MBP6064333.1 hypothetical protein [Bacteroidales bacterium]MDD2251322.1 hypothetical protein [Candidatus Cloacimonadota bacterium]MDD3693754.1 hypothetical protein [Oscillospiraceae bacterium]MDP9751180.1 hypothetical protein [Thermoanaerobacter pentosaceus]GIW57224.1 MAG: hypothetical protein KatS3mg083_169 [Candidatus Dojkabacteria bacterium]GLI18384.1 hypothetical prote
MKHKLKINISDNDRDLGIVKCRNVTLRERFLQYLLGRKQRVTIIVPGNSVKSVDIREVSEVDDLDAF